MQSLNVSVPYAEKRVIRSCLVVQEDGESEAVIQRHLQEAVQRLHDADMQASFARQVEASALTEQIGGPPAQFSLGNPAEAERNPAGAQQPSQPARGVATRRSRREEQEYRPMQVVYHKNLWFPYMSQDRIGNTLCIWDIYLGRQLVLTSG